MHFPLNFAHLQFLLEGTVWTIVLSLMAFGGGGFVGFLIALGRITPIRPIRFLVTGWVQLVQGTPLLIIMFMVYFGLPGLGFQSRHYWLQVSLSPFMPVLIWVRSGAAVFSQYHVLSGKPLNVWRYPVPSGCLKSYCLRRLNLPPRQRSVFQYKLLKILRLLLLWVLSS